MEKFAKIGWAVVFLILAISVILFISKPLINSYTYEHAEYCYRWSWGMNYYHDIALKKCVCEGKLVYNCPMFAACDSGEVRCAGKISGFEYTQPQFDNSFRTLDELEAHCIKWADSNCLWFINQTRSAELNASVPEP